MKGHNIVQYSSRINCAGHPYFPCTYQSPVKVENIFSKARNNSSVNIENMVDVLNFGITSKEVNADIG
jgi:hypothetical protein